MLDFSVLVKSQIVNIVLTKLFYKNLRNKIKCKNIFYF